MFFGIVKRVIGLPAAAVGGAGRAAAGAVHRLTPKVCPPLCGTAIERQHQSLSTPTGLQCALTMTDRQLARVTWDMSFETSSSRWNGL